MSDDLSNPFFVFWLTNDWITETKKNEIIMDRKSCTSSNECRPTWSIYCTVSPSNVFAWRDKQAFTVMGNGSWMNNPLTVFVAGFTAFSAPAADMELKYIPFFSARLWRKNLSEYYKLKEKCTTFISVIMMRRPLSITD